MLDIVSVKDKMNNTFKNYTIGKFSIYQDEELMQMLCAGEVLAFDELYLRYGKRLMTYFFRMLNYDKRNAQDALQDLFLKIAENPKAYNSNYAFKTWIFSIASNACKNYYRHQQVIQNHQDDIVYNLEQMNQIDLLNSLTQIDRSTFQNLLQQALQSLSFEKREAFVLKYQEDKSIAEIAQIQNCPEGSVKSRIYYTIKELEQKLKIFNPIN